MVRPSLSPEEKEKRRIARNKKEAERIQLKRAQETDLERSQRLQKDKIRKREERKNQSTEKKQEKSKENWRKLQAAASDFRLTNEEIAERSKELKDERKERDAKRYQCLSQKEKDANLRQKHNEEFRVSNQVAHASNIYRKQLLDSGMSFTDAQELIRRCEFGDIFNKRRDELKATGIPHQKACEQVRREYIDKHK